MRDRNYAGKTYKWSGKEIWEIRWREECKDMMNKEQKINTGESRKIIIPHQI
jgi:hypothetical protein